MPTKAKSVEETPAPSGPEELPERWGAQHPELCNLEARPWHRDLIVEAVK
jgi:hypothetical protein